jgi:hypothetical protein
MVVNRPALWVLFAICCLPSAIWVLRLRLARSFYRDHRSWREAPLGFVGALVDGVLTGVGVGLAVAFVVVIAASLWVSVAR